MPVSVRDLRREEYAPLPWSPPQVRFAQARQPIRLLKGHPGSGKTTALLNAADSSGAERVLYVTYSRNLAVLAREYFDRFCSSHKHFDVVTFPDLVRRMLGAAAPEIRPQSEVRERFNRDLFPFSRSLGAWNNKLTALYDEFHAHLIGDAVPYKAGRFVACKSPRVPERDYYERRARFLGQGPASAAVEAASRLEKLDSASLAQRYFPELALAWEATARLRSGRKEELAALLDFDCIAVDECQDLTPLEVALLIELTGAAGRKNLPLLMAGDEAQTVRPTDFEWAWLSDLLHAQLGTPTEHKLAANLRSPQRIAEIVNRVWDLYSHIQKQERPSGTGYAEIEDDATDQILYCTAAKGPDLGDLLTELASREGLALISLTDDIPDYVPTAARSAVLTVAEAKGLDFHSVCVLDAGSHMERIRREGRFRADADLEGLRKRLAIDQLRVALSRPTERLIWLDVSPSLEVIRQSIEFMDGGVLQQGVASCVPSALMKTLEEEELDLEERIQRCQTDARQFIDVKPEMAWSRAQQAVTLLGRSGSVAAVADEAARHAAFLTLSEVCFTLGIRNARLPSELGNPNLFDVSTWGATNAGKPGLSVVVGAIGNVHRAGLDKKMDALLEMVQILPRHKAQFESWVLLGIASKTAGWIEDLESALYNGRNATVLLNVLPPFLEALDVPDRDARMQRLRQKAAALLIKDKQFAAALVALENLAERQPKLEAICHEGLGNFRRAAESHLAAGNSKEALNALRSIPDVEAALKLAAEIGHPAADALQWMSTLQGVVAKRPDKFTKTVTAAEKKVLEQLLEEALGVTRKKPAARKAAAPRKAAPKKKATVKRVTRVLKKDWPKPGEYF
jgi:hypothetical protein